jgi:alpha-beta hydrolase superfamily lysophospholipase
MWLPENGTETVFITLHGFNDYSNFIKDNAVFFNENRIALYSYDQRGFGNAPFRGRWPGTQVLVDDVKTIVPLVRNKHSDLPIYLLGDSMGGAVVMLAMTGPNPPKVDRVILVAPAVWSRSSMPFYQRWALWIASRTIPWVTVTGKSLDITASDNKDMLKELGRDPLVIKGTRIDTIHGLSNLMDAAFNVRNGLNVPTLMLYGEKDELIPKEPTFAVYRQLQEHNSNQLRFIFYRDGYHMLLRDLQADVVMNDILSWRNSPTAPVPSVQNGVATEINKSGKVKFASGSSH